MKETLRMVKMLLPGMGLLVMGMLQSPECIGQYFGRNKVNYNRFDFKVVRTPHFTIYTYLEDTSRQNEFARMAEEWYIRHQVIFRDTFQEPNPLILYNAHGHFQQTQAISGLIDVGTGGVTEGLKNRVVMPWMESQIQTSHVLGHELVHAFQYSLLKKSDSLSFTDALNNLPLWMVEGLAEYMTLGNLDPHTAMWLRDAAIHNHLPSLKDLTNKPDQYFPYRWGQAFWAYVCGIWGDTIIRPLFLQTAKRGYKEALKTILRVDEKIFSQKWRTAILENYLSYPDSIPVTEGAGKRLADPGNAGKMNLIPSISPDGKWIAYWSEKDGLSFGLYLADASTGKILRKLGTHRLQSHIDDYNAYESSLAWSPDSRYLAYIAFGKGHNQLIIADIANTKNNRALDLAQLDGFSNPAWSPDGRFIVVSGLKNGQSDLYEYEVSTGKIKALTRDGFAELQPAYSPNGKWIAFATDRVFQNPSVVTPKTKGFTIALLNRQTGELIRTDLFEGSANLNPVFGNGDSIFYFLSDRDGFRNLYSYELNTGTLLQHTKFFTGISGITPYSPAFSISRNGILVYNFYSENQYSIYSISQDRLLRVEVNKEEIDYTAAKLPPAKQQGNFFAQTIEIPSQFILADSAIKRMPYRPRLQLDYLSNTGAGISTSRYGTGLAGGVNAMFSDMLGNHQLFGAVSLNGQLADAAGQFVFLNQKKRFNWGIGFSHIPYYSGFAWLDVDSLTLGNKKIEVLTHNTDIFRTFEDQFSISGAFPFSQTRRVEMGASYSFYYNTHERFTEYYDSLGYLIGYRHKKHLPAEKGFQAGNFYLAWVGDNSQFGVASPLRGHRFRFEAGQYLGSINANQLLADYRRYFRMAPFTFATRALFYGQFGKDVTNGNLPALYIGYPWLVRGYENVNFTGKNEASLTINELAGSKTIVANAEIRLPFTGPGRLSVIHSRTLLTELALFTDAGSAWGWTGNQNKKGKLILSSGVSFRLNFFGYLVIEPFYVIPWQNGGFRNTSIGLNFLPGW